MNLIAIMNGLNTPNISIKYHHLIYLYENREKKDLQEILKNTNLHDTCIKLLSEYSQTRKEKYENDHRRIIFVTAKLLYFFIDHYNADLLENILANDLLESVIDLILPKAFISEELKITNLILNIFIKNLEVSYHLLNHTLCASLYKNLTLLSNDLIQSEVLKDSIKLFMKIVFLLKKILLKSDEDQKTTQSLNLNESSVLFSNYLFAIYKFLEPYKVEETVVDIFFWLENTLDIVIYVSEESENFKNEFYTYEHLKLLLKYNQLPCIYSKEFILKKILKLVETIIFFIKDLVGNIKGLRDETELISSIVSNTHRLLDSINSSNTDVNDLILYKNEFNLIVKYLRVLRYVFKDNFITEAFLTSIEFSNLLKLKYYKIYFKNESMINSLLHCVMKITDSLPLLYSFIKYEGIDFICKLYCELSISNIIDIKNHILLLEILKFMTTLKEFTEFLLRQPNFLLKSFGLLCSLNLYLKLGHHIEFIAPNIPITKIHVTSTKEVEHELLKLSKVHAFYVKSLLLRTACQKMILSDETGSFISFLLNQCLSFYHSDSSEQICNFDVLKMILSQEYLTYSQHQVLAMAVFTGFVKSYASIQLVDKIAVCYKKDIHETFKILLNTVKYLNIYSFNIALVPFHFKDKGLNDWICSLSKHIIVCNIEDFESFSILISYIFQAIFFGYSQLDTIKLLLHERGVEFQNLDSIVFEKDDTLIQFHVGKEIIACESNRWIFFSQFFADLFKTYMSSTEMQATASSLFTFRDDALNQTYLKTLIRILYDSNSCHTIILNSLEMTGTSKVVFILNLILLSNQFLMNQIERLVWVYLLKEFNVSERLQLKRQLDDFIMFDNFYLICTLYEKDWIPKLAILIGFRFCLLFTKIEWGYLGIEYKRRLGLMLQISLKDSSYSHFK